ncbi:hypothetical protein CMO88_01830 [Candidatus Woesearchaeota archaeon]|nr:hypothetical protein [Candidatus Woesearchaeota archaeon]
MLGYRVIEGSLNIINPKLEKKFLGKATNLERVVYGFLWKLFWLAVIVAVLLTSFKLPYSLLMLLIALTIAIVRQSLRTYMKVKYGLSTAWIKRIIKSLFKVEISKEFVYAILIINMIVTIALVVIGYVAVLSLLDISA